MTTDARLPFAPDALVLGRFRVHAPSAARPLALEFAAIDEARGGAPVVVALPSEAARAHAGFDAALLAAADRWAHAPAGVAATIATGLEHGVPVVVTPALPDRRWPSVAAHDAARAVDPATDVAVAVRAAALALDRLHAAGFVHRALGPDRIAFDHAGRALLAASPFEEALAAVASERAVAQLVARPAPETAGDGACSAASDRHALAALARDAWDARHVGPRDEAASDRARDAAEPMRAVLARGLAADPAARFPSAVAFSTAFAAAVAAHEGTRLAQRAANVAAAAPVAPGAPAAPAAPAEPVAPAAPVAPREPDAPVATSRPAASGVARRPSSRRAIVAALAVVAVVAAWIAGRADARGGGSGAGGLQSVRRPAETAGARGVVGRDARGLDRVGGGARGGACFPVAASRGVVRRALCAPRPAEVGRTTVRRPCR